MDAKIPLRLLCLRRFRSLLLTLSAAAFLLAPVSARAAEIVLFLGDSFSMGAFGRTFDGTLRADGMEVYTYAAGGASPYYWLSSYESIPSSIGFWKKTPTTDQRLGYIRAVPKIEPLMDACKPDFVVVQTGVNLYATLRSKRRPKAENVAEITRLIDEMCKAIDARGARSYWVLPPASHEDRYPSSLQKELEQIMTSVVKKYNGGTYHSLTVTRFTDPYPATDGIHYGPEQSATWAEKTAGAFREFSKIDRTMLTEKARPVAKPVVVPELVASAVSDEPVAYESTQPETPVPRADEKAAQAAAALEAAVLKEKEKVSQEKALELASRSREQAAEAVDAETEVTAADMPPKTEVASTGAASAVGNGSAPVAVSPEDAPAMAVGTESKAKVDVSDSAEYELQLKLVAKSSVENLNEVTYSNALGVFEYEIIDNIRGGYPLEKIRIAHGIVLNRKATRANRREVGDTISMTVVPLSKYPSIQRWQTVDDLRPNFDLPLFVPKL